MNKLEKNKNYNNKTFEDIRQVDENGIEFWVVLSRDRGWQTDYTLKGVDSEFNSVWFDEVSSDDKVYMAIAHEVPVIGEKYSCYKMELIIGKSFLLHKLT